MTKIVVYICECYIYTWKEWVFCCWVECFMGQQLDPVNWSQCSVLLYLCFSSVGNFAPQWTAGNVENYWHLLGRIFWPSAVKHPSIHRTGLLPITTNNKELSGPKKSVEARLRNPVPCWLDLYYWLMRDKYWCLQFY